MIKIPRTMSTQHPDNVCVPFFSSETVIGGDDEIKEAYYVFSHLDCEEQLFDYEGKEADNFIIKKLLTRYPEYFLKNILGKDKILTFRIPNPNIEKTEGKILIELLNTIPRYTDTARMFYKEYGEEIIPIQEVYVPMTTSALDVIRVAEYYKKFVAGIQNSTLINNDISIKEWVGSFKPETIRVTPLVEDMDSLLNVDKITEEYIKAEKIKDYQRVWLARSDPSLNYSSLSAVLLNKIALQRLYKLEQKLSIEIFPIFGCGSSPFRGNFRPQTASQIMKGYPSVQTFTLQSSFKYDNPLDITKQAIEEIKNTKRKEPLFMDEEKILKIIEKVSMEYKKQVRLVADLVNKISGFIPERRKRKLHIGLFGYSRANEGIKLPRAIRFCGALYSIGFPPEIMGMNALNQKDIDYLKETCYRNIEYDLGCSMRYLNKDNLKFFPDKIQNAVKEVLAGFDGRYKTSIDEHHKQITSRVMEEIRKENIEPKAAEEEITRAASIRGFIG